MTTPIRVVLGLCGTLLSISALLMLGVYLLMFTESGARWSVEQALSRADGLKIESVQGTLSTGMRFQQIHWQEESSGIQVGSLSVRGEPSCLWRMTLCLPELVVEDVRAWSENTDQGAPKLPIIRWPLRLEIDDFRAHQLEWRSVNAANDAVQKIETLQFQASAQGKRLSLRELRSELAGLSLTGALTLQTGRIWSLQSRLEMLVATPPELQTLLSADSLQLVFISEGPLNALQVSSELTTGIPSKANFTFDLLRDTPVLEGSLMIPVWTVSQGELKATIRDSRIDMHGSPGNLQFKALSKLEQVRVADAPPVPTGNLQAEGKLLTGSISDFNLAYRSADGAHSLQWQGDVSAQGSATQTNGKLNVRSTRLEDWAPGAPGKLSMHSSLRAVWSPTGLRARIGGLQAHGEVRGQQLLLDAELILSSIEGPLRLSLEKVEGKVGPAHVSARGDLLPNVDVRGMVQVEKLKTLHADLHGSLSAGLRVAGDVRAPEILLDLNVLNAGWTHYRADSIKGTGKFHPDREPAIELELQASNVAGLPEALPLTELVLRASGTTDQGRMHLSADGEESAALLVAEFSRTASGAEIQMREAMLRAAIAGTWTLATPTRLRWDSTRRSLHLADDMCLHGAAEVCVIADSHLLAQGDSTRFQVARLNQSLWAKHLPDGLAIETELQGGGEIVWTDAEPTLELILRSGQGSVRMAARDGLPATEHEFTNVELEGSVDSVATRTRLHIQSATLGEVLARVQASRAENSLEGNVQVTGLQLAPWRGFLPELEELSGQLQADLSISGSRNDPQVNGDIHVSDAGFAGAVLPVQVSQLQMAARLAGDNLTFQGGFHTREEARNDAGPQSLSGSATFGGDASWAPDNRALNLQVAGEQLHVQVGGHTALEMDAKIVARVTPDQFDAQAEARILKGNVQLPRQGTDGVWLAEDVILIPAPPKQTADRPLPFAKINTSLDLDLGQQLFFSGHGLDGWLTGRVLVTDLHADKPRGKGSIDVRDGRYRAYGQKLKIRRGRLRFRGKLFDPMLDVEAVRPLSQVLAGVRVTGIASAPEVRLFSEPSMAEEEILSWLVLGKPLGSSNAQDSSLLSAALVSYGLRSGEERSAQMAERLGIQQFEVGTSNGDGDAGVFASGYLSPRLFVRYGVSGAEAANSLTLRYQVLPRLFLEASSGMETAVDLLYSFAF